MDYVGHTVNFKTHKKSYLFSRPMIRELSTGKMTNRKWYKKVPSSLQRQNVVQYAYCTTPHLYEKDIKILFLRAFGKLMAGREHILEDIQLVQAALCDCTELDTQQATLAEEMEIVGELIRQCIEENTIKVQNQEEYMERYERHTRRYEKMKKRYEAIEAERQRRKEQNDRISAFAAILAGQSEMPIEFNDDLWLAAVDHATVNADETVTFTFKSGIEITEQM